MIDIQAIAGPDEVEELIFDGPDDFTPDIAAPATSVATATGRKRIARAAKAAAIEAATPDVPSEAIATDAAPAPPPAFAPAPATPAPGATLPARLTLAALALGLLTASLSATGLLLASRTIAHADLAARSAAQEQALLARLPGTLTRLDDLVAREQAALARLGDGRTAGPVSIVDLHRELDALRLGIAQRQPQADLQTQQLVRSGQGELVERLGTMSATLDRLDRASRGAK